MSEKKISSFQLWLMAIRPKTLPAAAGPVLVGTAVALFAGGFRLFPALAAFLVALLLQVAVNLANDYFDAKNEIDSEKRLGPVRVTQSGLIPAAHVKMGMVLCLVVAGLIFCYLAVVGGWLMLLVAVASVCGALAYSGGPYPLASHGLGELFVFIFFGPVAVCCTYYVQAGRFSSLSLVASFVPGLLITAIMVINNLRDIPTDAPSGKNTLAVRLGRRNTVWFYRLLLLLWYAVPLYLLAAGVGGPMLLLSLISGPMAFVLFREVESAVGSELNQTLARTAQFSLFASLLFSIGLIL
ncbi:1,4-dihydroxy-2-naphthoate polyprenyltransferase [Desulfopila sp. IMCC35008]|uniref:1,4-dihydroxy-2-naphthoate polyprenyltransferase n=1 Tax=Desulfopila sp. IMCC35008 TaxID=2653858 RepID=UPI00197AA7CE|nr:1,4-dihydroxy-2-naphthoate polyprenyltransferase [Desulfopila sp. IMCC35008]